MLLISDGYRDQLSKMHIDKISFGAIGCRHTGRIISLMKKMGTNDVLDYGCGKSTLARNLPFSIKEYDPAIPKHSELPKPADIVVCTDVLEHIEPEYLDNVISHLNNLVKKVGYFTACTIPAVKKLPDGRNAHLTVEPAKWWINKFWEHFEVVSFTKLDNEIIFMVELDKGAIC